MPGSEIALPKCHSKDVDQGDWLSRRNWIRLPESKRKGRVVQSRRKEKNKNIRFPHAALCGPKNKATAVRKHCSLLVRHTQRFQGGGALIGGPSPPAAGSVCRGAGAGLRPAWESWRAGSPAGCPARSGPSLSSALGSECLWHRRDPESWQRKWSSEGDPAPGLKR